MAGSHAPVKSIWGIFLLLLLAGCSGRDLDTLRPAPLNTDPIVFAETFGAGVDYQAFLNSDVNALSLDTSQGYQSTASLRVSVPGPGGVCGRRVRQ